MYCYRCSFPSSLFNYASVSRWNVAETRGLSSKYRYYSQFWLYNGTWCARGTGLLNRSPIIFLFPRNYFLIIFPSLPRIEYNRISATRITLFPPSDRWSGVSRRVRVGGGGQDRTIATVVESGSSYRSSRCCSQVRPAIATTFLHLSRNCSQVVLAFDNAVTISSSRDNISLSVENSGIVRICFDRVPSTFAREISVWKNCAMHARYFESILFRRNNFWFSIVVFVALRFSS